MWDPSVALEIGQRERGRLLLDVGIFGVELQGVGLLVGGC